MSTLGDMIRQMGAAGASPEAIAIAAEALEATSAPNTTAKQARNARYYQARKSRKASESATETVLIKTPTETTENALKRLNSVASRVRDNPSLTVLSGKEKLIGTLKGSRLSMDWKPTPDDHQFALKEGLDPEEIERATDEFGDYWRSLAGSKSCRGNWSLTWRNRIRQVADRKRQREARMGSRPASGGNGQGITSFADIIAERRSRAGH